MQNTMMVLLKKILLYTHFQLLNDLYFRDLDQLVVEEVTVSSRERVMYFLSFLTNNILNFYSYVTQS